MKKIAISLFLIMLLLALPFASFVNSASIKTTNNVKTEQTDSLSSLQGLDMFSTDDISEISSIVVTDSDPFYSLITTPLAVNYNETGHQNVIPLYTMDFTNPSSAVLKAMDQIGRNSKVYVVSSLFAPKKTSLQIAKTFWNTSEKALLIKSDQEGYNLGVLATPLASYLNMPVIVSDIIDQEVNEVLDYLGVSELYICGNFIFIEPTSYDKTHFATVDEVVNETINVVIDRFGSVDYITITNPIDARKIVPLDTTIVPKMEKEIEGISSLRLKDTALVSLKYGGDKFNIGNFSIPADYKYALIKFEGINYQVKDIDELGDAVTFKVISQNKTILTIGTDGGIPIRDDNGNIIIDRCYTETVLYDMGGTEYNVLASANYVIEKKGDVEVNIVVEKLPDPVYPMMKGFSSIAPYLTAYHKGIVFGKPEFAFTADDDVLVEGENCPGFYMPRKNSLLREPSNEHVYGIHQQLNMLLAKLAEIPVEDLLNLTKYYKENPVYISLVGGATVLPQISYDNIAYKPTSSDVIYANIDPIHEWNNTANDTYSYYPYLENIVGRIIGYDIQDASALIARTLFYNDILEEKKDWKNNAAVIIGCSNDFQKNLIYRAVKGFISRGEPLKWWTGYAEISAERVQEQVFNPAGFETQTALYLEAMRKGFSNDAINTLKWKTNLLNSVFLNPSHLKLAHEDIVIGQELEENSNFIFVNAHGSSNLCTAGDTTFSGLGYGYLILPLILQIVAKLIHFGPLSSLGSHTNYNIRGVGDMNLGPSVMFLESCICGEIDGHHPREILSPTYIHSGVNTLISASITTNVGGGYLEPKNRLHDNMFTTLRAYILNKRNAKAGTFPDSHFGFRIHEDMMKYLEENDSSVGMAFRDAKNKYLPADANWTLWWAPPLRGTDSNTNENPSTTGIFEQVEKTKLLPNKYTAFQEYQLYGDPAFNPYEPVNEG